MHIEVCHGIYTEMPRICFKIPQQRKMKEKEINETNMANS